MHFRTLQRGLNDENYINWYYFCHYIYFFWLPFQSCPLLAFLVLNEMLCSIIPFITLKLKALIKYTLHWYEKLKTKKQGCALAAKSNLKKVDSSHDKAPHWHLTHVRRLADAVNNFTAVIYVVAALHMIVWSVLKAFRLTNFANAEI
jgi:hypothetical protein